MRGESAILDAHPTPAQLAGLVAGRLTEEVAAAIESHVESCDACAKALEHVSAGGDSFVARLRELAPESSSSDEHRAFLDAFDAAWRNGDRPDLVEYWSESPSPDDVQLLARLISFDMSHRQGTGETVRAEDYVQVFPSLEDEANRQQLLTLIDNERFLREPHEPELAFGEYAQRFPKLAAELEKRWERAPLRPWKQLPLRLNCPNCNAPIQVAASEAEDAVTCPLCDEGFEINLDRTATWSPDELPQLGKFQLQEKLGHGAYGTVYKAKDVDTDRHVAVKIPRSGLILDDSDSNRFLREARAAAQLDHSAIVPIYEVGRTDEFPYIVYRFVEGMTLRDMLAQRRFNFRQSAELAFQLAEALEHAHKRGVVHRDLKPGNVMLERRGDEDADTTSPAAEQETVATAGSTESGSTSDSRRSKVSKKLDSALPYQAQLLDFGLARRDEGEVTLTAHGAKVGTPQYWSPEQAKGESHTLDGRSDVFSLGIILYELLTGERPFLGTRQALEFAIRYEEPRAPRKLNARIPKDLETICLKCLRKEKGRRYTAAELVADLRRWLAGEAIEARPVGRVERGVLWAKRRPAVALLSTSLLIALVAGTVVSTVLAIDKQAALNAKTTEFNRAENALRDVRLSIDQYVDVVENEELLKDPRFKEVIPKLLAFALEQYEAYVEEHAESQNAEVRAEVAETLFGVGRLHSISGDMAESVRAFEASLELLDSLLQLDPNEYRYRNAQSRCYLRLGNSYRELGKSADAMAAFKDALQIRETLRNDHHDNDEYLEELSEIQSGIATLNLDSGRLQDAKAALTRRRDILQRLMQDYPQNLDFRFSLALTIKNLGVVYRGQGQPEKALADVARAANEFEQLSNEDYSNASYRNEMAHAIVLKGVLTRDTGQLDEALAISREGLAIYEALVHDHPTVKEYELGRATTHNNIGVFLSQSGKFDSALTEFQAALAIQNELANNDLDMVEVTNGMARTYYNLGNALSGLNRLDEARIAYDSSIELLESVVAQSSSVIEYRLNLAQSWNNLGRLHERTKNADESLEAFERALELNRPLLSDDLTTTDLKNVVGVSFFGLGIAHLMKGQTDEAIKAFEEAAAVQGELADDAPSVTTYLHDAATSNYNLAATLAQAGRFPEALPPIKRSVAFKRKAYGGHPESAELRGDLAELQISSARLCMYSGQLAEAEAEFKGALENPAWPVSEHEILTQVTFEVGLGLYNLGEFYREAGNSEKALKAMHSAAQLFDEMPTDTPDLHDVRIDTYTWIGRLHEAQHQTERALWAYDFAIRLAEPLASDEPDGLSYSIQLGGAYVNKAIVLREQVKSLTEARDYYDLAITRLSSAVESDADLPNASRFLKNAYWGRAEVHESLGDWSLAVDDWKKAVELQSEDLAQQAFILSRLSRSYAMANEHSETMRVTRRFLTLLENPTSHVRPGDCYNIACALGLASAAVAADDALPEEERESLEQQYSAHAIKVLGHAADMGFFLPMENRALLDNDSDLDALRDREDFKELLRKLDGAQVSFAAC